MLQIFKMVMSISSNKRGVTGAMTLPLLLFNILINTVIERSTTLFNNNYFYLNCKRLLSLHSNYSNLSSPWTYLCMHKHLQYKILQFDYPLPHVIILFMCCSHKCTIVSLFIN